MEKNQVGRPRKDGIKATVVVTRDATAIWEASAARLGVSKTAALEMALREFGERRGITIDAGAQA